MNLATYKFPDISGIDLAFPTVNTTPKLVAEAERRNPRKGMQKFNELFFKLI